MKKLIITASMLLLISQAGYSQKKSKKEANVKATTATTTSTANGFSKTPKGLEYKIVSHGTGTTKANVGDFVTFTMEQYIKDSLLLSTQKNNNGQPVTLPVRPPSFNGDVVEGFTLLSAGDSAVFYMPVDSMMKVYPQLPPFLHPGDKLEFRIKMLSVKTEKEMEAEHEAAAAKQKGVDEKDLQEYFTKNNIKAEKTASGLYYKIIKTGTGDAVKAGQKVTVNYTGSLLNGTKFDSNVDSNFHHVQPFTFTIGQGQVIKGWDEGVALLKKGGKAMLYIPSTLAYGERSPAPTIPANSILVFDVEVTDIQ